MLCVCLWTNCGSNDKDLLLRTFAGACVNLFVDSFR